MFSFFGYIFLFIMLCIFIIASIAGLNIYKKSFDPKNALIFTVIILSLILINGVFATFAMTRIKDAIQNGTPKAQTSESKSF